MRILTLAYLALLCLSVLLVSTCSAPTTPPMPAPLDLQRELSRALDSADRAACGAPVGCECRDGVRYCPDPKPTRP